MAIDFPAIEAALKTWLSGATGIAQNRIIHPHEKAPGVASGSYLTMKLDGPWGVGGRPEVQHRTDLGQPAGQEVQSTVIEHNEFTVSVQAYTLQEDKGGTAKELLASARIALSRPSQVGAFNAAGFSFVYAERVNSLPRLPPEGEGRANMDVHFYVFDSVVDPVGYIDHMGIDPATGAKFPTGSFS